MKAIDSFRQNIVHARDLGSLYKALKSITTPALSIDDILRSQIVMSVSALDHYVHEVVRQGILSIFKGERPVVSGFKKFEVPLLEAKTSITSESSTWLDALIRHRHQFMSFQHPDKIADAIRLIHSEPLWPALEARLGVPCRDLKEELKLIIDRRNKIAHESDVDPSYPGSRWPITYGDATHATDFIEELVEAIDVEVS